MDILDKIDQLIVLCDESIHNNNNSLEKRFQFKCVKLQIQRCVQGADFNPNQEGFVEKLDALLGEYGSV